MNLLKILFIIYTFLVPLLLSSCSGSSSGSASDNSSTSDAVETTTTLQTNGKLAQGYVVGAQVWLDTVNENGLGNFKRDPGEFDTISNASGSYELAIKGGAHVIATQGGVYLDSSGKEVSAMPMLAPLPLPAQTTTNITPLTTLVTTQPGLKDVFDQLGGWNVDIANPNGTPAGVLRVAKTVESISKLLNSGDDPISLSSEATIKSLSIFAEKLVVLPAEQVSSQTALQNVSLAALDDILSDSNLTRLLGEEEKNLVKSSASQLVDAITSSIPESGQVVENQVVANIEKKTEEVEGKINQALTEQVIVVFGGIGINFDPIIAEIKLEWIESILQLTAKISYEQPESLVFKWSNESKFLIENSSSLNANLLNFDNETVKITFEVTAPSGVVVAENCNWSENPTICTFISTQ